MENSQLDEIYNFRFNNCSRRFLTFSFFVEVYRRFKLDVDDFKLASISGITGSQIHYMASGRSLADRFRLAHSGGKVTAPID